MNCGRVSNQLSAYLDRELTGTEMLQIRSHLGDCEPCRADYEALGRMKRLLGGLGSMEPPPGFVAATLHRFETAGLHAPPATARFGGRGAARRLCRAAGAAYPLAGNLRAGGLALLSRRPGPGGGRLGRLLRWVPWQPLTLGVTSAVLTAVLIFTGLVLLRPRHADELVATKPPLVLQGMDPEGQEPASAPPAVEWDPNPPAIRPVYREQFSGDSLPWVSISLQAESAAYR